MEREHQMRALERRQILCKWFNNRQTHLGHDTPLHKQTAAITAVKTHSLSHTHTHTHTHTPDRVV